MEARKPGQKGWCLLKFLGSGGLGQVFLASVGGERKAVKFIHSSEDSLRDFLRREVKLLSRLKHPNLVRVEDYFDEGLPGHTEISPELQGHQISSGPCFSMEYIDGLPLDRSSELSSSADWVSIFRQVCLGLHFLHSHEIFHRDLKPGNILIDSQGRVKILDFSLAWARDLETARAGGTPAYLAPESYRGVYDGRSDLFSFGVLLYRLLTGSFPYPPSSDSSVWNRPRPLGLETSAFPPDLCEWIDRMIERDPAKRPYSSLTLLRYLKSHDYGGDVLENPILRHPPYIGREKPMGEILAQCSEESLKITLLQGPTGVGRSRFLEELRWVLRLKGIDFFRIAFPADGNWLQILGGAFLKEGEALPPDPGEWGLHFAEAFRGRRPVFVFADLDHWPESSFSAIRLFLLGLRRVGAPLQIFLEWNSDSMLHSPFEALADGVVSLTDLNRQESRELLEAALAGESLDPSAAEEILQNSSGRPLLLLENLREVLESSHEAADPSFKISENLQAAQAQRTRRLSSSAQALLGALAVESEGNYSAIFSLGLKPWGDGEAALLKLQEGGFLEAPGFGDPRLSHSSLVPALFDSLPEKRQRQAHGFWRDYFFCSSLPEGVRAWGIARHALFLDGEEDLKAFGLKALAHLFQTFQWKEAYDLSLRLLKSGISQDRCLIYSYQAPLCYRLGHYDLSIEAYGHWIKLREDDESRLQETKYHYFCALAHSAAGRREAALKALKSALEAGDPRRFPSLSGYHIRALNLQAALHEKEGHWKEAERSLQGAQGFEISDSLLQGETSQRLAKLTLRLLRFSEAQEYLRSCREHYEKTGDLKARAVGLSLSSQWLHEQGELEGAEAKLHEAELLLRQANDPIQRARNQANRGMIRSERGFHGQALKDLESAHETLQALGDEEGGRLALLQWARATLFAGNWKKTEVLWEEILKIPVAASSDYQTLVTLGRAEKLALQGEDLKALEILDGFLISAQDPPDQHRLRASLEAAKIRMKRGEWNSQDLRALALEAMLSELKGPVHQVWKGLLRFEKTPLELSNKENALSVLKAIQSLEGGEIKRTLLRLFSSVLKRRGLTAAHRQAADLARLERNEIFRNLPEEIQMDYRKNRFSSGEDASPDTFPDPENFLSLEKFRQFCEIARQISQKKSVDEILERVMDAAIELSGAERGFLILKRDPDQPEARENLEILTARHLNRRALEGEEYEFSHSLVLESMAQGGPVLSSSALEDPRFSGMQSIHRLRLQSILVVPFELEGKVFGAIYLDHPTHPDRFRPRELSLTLGFAGQAALAIQKGRMLESLHRANEGLALQVKDQGEQIQRMSDELVRTRKDLKGEYGKLVGESRAMLQVFHAIDTVAGTKIPVWIWGESGTGKELVARALHDNGPRRKGPFVSENCSAIPETLIESELFGHKKGAFTHADRDRTGLLEQAHGGTLFLDEIADMSSSMQAKLLRALQEGEVRPVGSNKKVQVDFRLVTASHRSIEALVREGKFREDLFYRINGTTLSLPPLRERPEDIPLLVHHLVRKISHEFGVKAAQISPEVIQYLMKQPWPGNVRQLDAVLRNLLLFAQGKPVTRSMLGGHLKGAEKTAKIFPSPAPPFSAEEDRDREELIQSLVRHHFDKHKVAEELCIALKSVYARMRRFRIPTRKALLQKYLQER